MKKLYVFLILLCGLLPVSAGAKESSVGVVISEINWAGSSASNADEWIELYNGSSETVDLGGWILAGAATSGDALAIEEGVEIDAGETLLISNYATGSEKSSLTIESNLATSSLSLSNSGLDIYLAMTDGTIVDQVNELIGSSNPFVSMERNLETLEWTPATESMNLSDEDQLGTPGFVQSTDKTVVEEFKELEAVKMEETVEEPVLIDSCIHEVSALQAEIERLEVLLQQEPEAFEAVEVVEVIEPLEEIETSETSETLEELNTTENIEEENVEIVNVAPEPIAYATGDVLINEFVSNPEEGEEWIELLFMSDVDLDGWSIEDEAEKSTNLEGNYLEGEFLVIEAPKGQLNNGGDSVLLFNASNQLIDSIAYGDDYPVPEKGEALARTLDNVWALTTELTPGQKNMFPVVYTEQLVEDAESEKQSTEELGMEESQDEEVTHIVVDIAESVSKEDPADQEEVQDDEESTVNTVSGTVTALPGTFGRQIAFIDGQQLYFYHADWPTLQLGDVVQVSGEYSSARGESRLKISSAEDIVVSGFVELEPIEVDVATTHDVDDGTLVRVTGEFLSRDSNRLTLADETGELIVFAHVNSGVNWSSVQSSMLQVTGVVRTIDGETRLYPRSVEDVTEITEELEVSETVEGLDNAISAAVNDTTEWGPWIGGTIVTATGAVLAYWFVKYKTNLNSVPISL